MKYNDLSSDGSYPYPDHGIDPKLKTEKWCIQYAKAAAYDTNYSYPKGMFFNNKGTYQKNRMYSIGKQPVDQYKPILGVDAQNNDTQMLADWTVRPVVIKTMNKALARIHKVKYRPQATPVDMLAKSESDKYLSAMKSKLLVRQMMAQQNPELANHPLLAYQPGEPVDIEEMEMRLQFGEQFNKSKDAEIAIELGFYENNLDSFLKEIDKDLWDIAVAGYKEWLGDDLKPRFRRVDPDLCIVSHSNHADFRDIVHAGEVTMVALIDLAVMKDRDGNAVFTEAELKEFASSIAGRWNNPKAIGTGYRPIDKFKCQVLDLEFFSYDTLNYRVAPDSNGNMDFRKADFGRGKNAAEKYMRKTVKNVYRVKWIMGTDKCYDWGVVENPKRSNNLKDKGETSLSYKFCAINFYQMMAESMIDQLIPDLDDYQLTIMRVQNWKNRAVPSGFFLDLEALENVAIDKAGENMTKKQILQMFLDTGILLGRSKDLNGDPMGPNWKPVMAIENNVLSELVSLYQELQNISMRIESTCGYNAVTSGTPQERMLTPGYESAEMSTEDTLYPIVFAREQLVKQLAKDVLCRMQQGVRLGKVEGYMPYMGALNQNSLTFVQISKNIAFREYGIMIELRTTNEQKMWLLQQMQNDIANGFLDSSDAAILINTHNVKQAMMIWAYKVKKAKEAIEQSKMAQIQENNKGAAEAADRATQGQAQNLQMESQLRIQELMAKGQIDKELLAMKLEMERETTQVDANAKIYNQNVATQGALQKQIIANQVKTQSNQDK